MKKLVSVVLINDYFLVCVPCKKPENFSVNTGYSCVAYRLSNQPKRDFKELRSIANKPVFIECNDYGFVYNFEEMEVKPDGGGTC